MNLKVKIAGVEFKNPFIAASGTYGFAKSFAKLYDVSLLGGVCLKGLTLKKKDGNAPHRVAETPCGMLNSVGLQNPGVDAFLKDTLPYLKTLDTVVIANVCGNTVEEYCELASKLNVDGIDMFELNISCPNVKSGMAFGINPESVEEVAKEVKKHCKKPLIVKLSPNVADIKANAKAAQEGGADAISLINTLLGMAIDVKTFKPKLNNVMGGLSGPAVKPVAVRMVYECAKTVSIPVIGLGGIVTGEDAAEFMIAGANAVQIGTANLIDPFAMPKIINQFEDYLKSMGISDANSIVGKIKLN